jgi:phosphoglycerate dehydrogenase-like enzyme
VNLVWCGTGWLSIVEIISRRLPAGCSIRVRDPARPIAAELADAQVIVPSNCPIDAAAIAAPRDLRLIQQPAAGYERIDLAAARARGVPVCNTPAANSRSMADAALLLILALTRRLPRARRAFAERRIGEPVGVELHGKVLGVVGLGRTGRALAAAAEALGMRVRSVTSTSPLAELEALFAESDVISIHCPQTPATTGLFDRAAFARLKPGAFLVNCARGPIIDRDALEEALASGRLGGVGLDVYWEEPWDPADPLYARDDVVTLPHIGGSTAEAYERIAGIVAENVRRTLAGEPLLHVIG